MKDSKNTRAVSVKEFFNFSEEDLYNKKENIFVPICLGNRFFVDKTSLTDNVKIYIKWALEHTKERVLVIVADKIQDTNYFVRGNTSLPGSRKRVLKDGQEIKNRILELVQKDFSEFQDRLDVIAYQEYQQHDPYNYEVTNIVYKEFKNNPAFARAVIETVKTTQSDRAFSEEEYIKLSDYILDEFSLVYTGVEYNQIYYGLYIYPQVDSTVYLIENIQHGSLFQTLTEQLPKRKVGLAVVNDTNILTADVFYDSISSSYEELINTPEVSQTLHQHLLKILNKYHIRQGNVLDIGCGPGNIKSSIRKGLMRRFSFTGIDVSTKMLNLAQQKKYKVIHGRIEEILPILPDNSFEYIFAISSLHFVQDIQSVLRHIERIATKGYIISFDEMTDEYKKGFATVCESPVYNHIDTLISNVKEDVMFNGWVSPREKKPIKVRMIYKELQ